MTRKFREQESLSKSSARMEIVKTKNASTTMTDDFLNAETVPPTPTNAFAHVLGLVETSTTTTKESSRAYDFYAKALKLLTCFQCKKRCLMDESAQAMEAFYCSTYETCSMCAQCVCRKCFDKMQEVAITSGKTQPLCPSCKAGHYPLGHAGSTILSWLTKKDVVAEKVKPQTFNFGTNTEPRTQSLALRESTSDEDFAIMRNFYFNALKLLKCAVCKTDCFVQLLRVSVVRTVHLCWMLSYAV